MAGWDQSGLGLGMASPFAIPQKGWVEEKQWKRRNYESIGVVSLDLATWQRRTAGLDLVVLIHLVWSEGSFRDFTTSLVWLRRGSDGTTGLSRSLYSLLQDSTLLRHILLVQKPFTLALFEQLYPPLVPTYKR